MYCFSLKQLYDITDSMITPIRMKNISIKLNWFVSSYAYSTNYAVASSDSLVDVDYDIFSPGLES